MAIQPETVEAALLDSWQNESGYGVSVRQVRGKGTYEIRVEIDAERTVMASHEDFSVALAMVASGIDVYHSTL